MLAMTEPAATLIDILRALADPTRLRIMRLLTRMELAVGELAQVLDQSQPRVSRHIRILAEVGLAERRREGSWVFVRGVPGTGGAPPSSRESAASTVESALWSERSTSHCPAWRAK